MATAFCMSLVSECGGWGNDGLHSQQDVGDVVHVILDIARIDTRDFSFTGREGGGTRRAEESLGRGQQTGEKEQSGQRRDLRVGLDRFFAQDGQKPNNIQLEIVKTALRAPPDGPVGVSGDGDCERLDCQSSLQQPGQRLEYFTDPWRCCST